MTWWNNSKLHPKAKNRFVVVFGSSFFIPSVKTISKPKIDFDTKEYKLLNHKFNYPGNGTWQPIEIKFSDMNGLADEISNNDTFDTSHFLWQILNNTGYAYPYLDGDSSVSNNPYYNNVQDQKKVISGGHHIATKPTFDRAIGNTNLRSSNSYRTITTPEKSSTIANSFGNGLAGPIDKQKGHYSRQKISIYQLSPESRLDKGKSKNPEGASIVECWHLVNPIVKSIAWGDLSYDSDELVEYSLNIIYDWAIFDRKAIGEQFSVDAKSYREFAKSFVLAQSAIDQELLTQKQNAIQEFQGGLNFTDDSDVILNPPPEVPDLQVTTRPAGSGGLSASGGGIGGGGDVDPLFTTSDAPGQRTQGTSRQTGGTPEIQRREKGGTVDPLPPVTAETATGYSSLDSESEESRQERLERARKRAGR